MGQYLFPEVGEATLKIYRRLVTEMAFFTDEVSMAIIDEAMQLQEADDATHEFVVPADFKGRTGQAKIALDKLVDFDLCEVTRLKNEDTASPQEVYAKTRYTLNVRAIDSYVLAIQQGLGTLVVKAKRIKKP